MGLNFLKIFNVDDDKKALESLLETGKQKLIEAGAEIVKLAGDEAEGLTIDVHLTLTVTRKK